MAPPPHRQKIVVIDDDPTGSQTVHGCPLLLRWDQRTLVAGLRDPSPLLFLLANTRALSPPQAAERMRQICRALAPGLQEAGIEPGLVVSRGDSTLRGHFPLETAVIAAELGPFDATLVVPAFLEGGRTTVEGVHLLQGRPVHESAFARDAIFGYGTSVLADWIEARSAGRIPAAAVERIGTRELDPGRRGALIERLRGFSGNRHVVVDAERPEHLAALAAAVRTVVAPAGERPRRLLFQSAASLLNALAVLPPQPLSPAGLAALRRRGPGLVMVGSHVPLADAQLERLLAEPGCCGVEIAVPTVQRVIEGPLPARLLAALEAAWLEELRGHLASGRTPVLFTSRGELRCRDAAAARGLGQALAALMARLAATLAPELGYLISKGGTTTQTLLAEGLALASVRLEGQLLPGLSMVRVPREPAAAAAGIEGLPVLTVPGNLGDACTLFEAWRWMEWREGTAPGADQA